MNLYNVDIGWQGYDTYSGAVICAKNRKHAVELMLEYQTNDNNHAVTCNFIGKAAGHVTEGIVRDSFHAG